jgi:hypothetical protein
VTDITPQAEKWKGEDQASFKRSVCWLPRCRPNVILSEFSRYAATYGVVGDMATHDEIRSGELSAQEPSPAAPTTSEEEEKEATVDSNVFFYFVPGSSPQLQTEPTEISVPKEMSAHIIEKQTMQFVVPGKIIHLSIANGLPPPPFSSLPHLGRVLSRGPL